MSSGASSASNGGSANTAAPGDRVAPAQAAKPCANGCIAAPEAVHDTLRSNRQARHDAGLTQAQLAQRLETTTPYVTNVEAGRTNRTGPARFDRRCAECDPRCLRRSAGWTRFWRG